MDKGTFPLLRGIIIIILAVLLFLPACKKEIDRSFFSSEMVLKGNLEDGRVLYLIPEIVADSINGQGFIYTNSAVADIFSFRVDKEGRFSSRKGDILSFSGDVSVKKLKKQLILQLNVFQELDINRQKIKLTRWEPLTKSVSCHERFYEQVFDSIVVHKDIQYGEAPGFYTSHSVDTIPHGEMEPLKEIIIQGIKLSAKKARELPLYMDIYEPYDDQLKKRPLFVFMHGGAFFFGDKENLLQRKLTQNLVKRGYVVASINYRLGSTLLGVEIVERMIYRGVQDANAALRYLAHNSKKYGIDPEQIYIAGSSAGAIVALTTAFMEEDEVFKSVDKGLFRKDLGGLYESGNSFSEKFNISGVISLWGAVTDLDIIDERNADIPVLLFHGTSDEIVHCVSGLPFQERVQRKFYDRISSNWQLYGSQSICNYMQKDNRNVKYVPFKGCGHEPQVNKDGTYNENMNVIQNEIDRFLYTNISGHYIPSGIEGNSKVSKSDKTPVYSVANVNSGTVQWFVDGGFILKENRNLIEVVWFNLSKKGLVKAYVTDKNKTCWVKELNIEIEG